MQTGNTDVRNFSVIKSLFAVATVMAFIFLFIRSNIYKIPLPKAFCDKNFSCITCFAENRDNENLSGITLKKEKNNVGEDTAENVFRKCGYDGFSNIVPDVFAQENKGTFKVELPLDFPSTCAKAAMVMEAKSRAVIYGKNENQPLANASTTKIVTALTVLRKCDINAEVVIPREAVGIEGSSIYLKEGEVLTVRELLYGLMLRSGNDAAVALALFTSGSIEAFAEEMNTVARECGALSSNFVNPHGLHNDNHYTTAYDLAVISSEAIKNSVFREIVSSKNVYIGREENKRLLVNKNKLLKEDERVIGIKTGYTKKAGRCFVGALEENGAVYVAVVLDCGPMFEESFAMMRASAKSFELKSVVLENQVLGAVNVGNKSIPVKSKSSYYALVRKNGDFSVKIELIPYEKGEKTDVNDESIGKFRIYASNQLIFSEKLYTIL